MNSTNPAPPVISERKMSVGSSDMACSGPLRRERLVIGDPAEQRPALRGLSRVHQARLAHALDHAIGNAGGHALMIVQDAGEKIVRMTAGEIDELERAARLEHAPDLGEDRRTVVLAQVVE